MKIIFHINWRHYFFLIITSICKFKVFIDVSCNRFGTFKIMLACSGWRSSQRFHVKAVWNVYMYSLFHLTSDLINYWMIMLYVMYLLLFFKVDVFEIEAVHLGELVKIVIGHNNPEKGKWHSVIKQATLCNQISHIV